MPTVSVIIPTYNRENRIVESINYVLNQSYYDLECIVVDDGSTDCTCEVVNKIRDCRLRYYKLPNNQGACYARNFGVKLAKGRYIAFQDSDDVWYKEKIEKQLEYLYKHNADFVFCKMIQKNITIKKGVEHFPEQIKKDILLDTAKIIEKSCASTQCIFLKKECFQTISFDNKLPRFQDWDFIIQASEKYNIFFQDEVLVEHIITSDCITANDKKGLEACKYIYNKYKDIFESNNKAKAYIFENQGIFSEKLGIKSSRLFWIAVCSNPTDIKYWIRFILSYIGILCKIYKWRKVL